MAVQGTYAAGSIITANTAPSTGTLNRYNAASGALTPPLPALSSLNDGANFIVAKDAADTTLNAITLTRNGSDTFSDGSATLVLTKPGERAWLQVVTIAGTKYWSVLMAGELNPRGGVAATTSQVSVANTTSATNLVLTTLPAASLLVGATYRIKLFGTVRVISTSGTLTFTPYIQNTALNTIQMASQGSAAGPVGFSLEIVITVRSTGASGTAIAHGLGFIGFTTPAMLTSTNTSTTTINTTSGAASTDLLVKATWATANSNNSLVIENATVERIL